MNMNLHKSVIDALHACKGRWPEIASNAGVGYSWLCKIASGAIPDPRIKNVEKVANAMSKMQLFPAKVTKNAA
jgi:predicted transcriptional regulator